MSRQLTFNYNARQKAIDRIRAQNNDQRSQYIIDVFVKYFGEGIQKNPKAFSGRFRKMASTAFNFYRGSALLFYQDLKDDQDKWISTNPNAGNIFIHVNKHFFLQKIKFNFLFYFRVIYMLKILVHI